MEKELIISTIETEKHLGEKLKKKLIKYVKESIAKTKIEEKLKELDKKEKEELKGLKGQDRYYVKQIYMYKRSVLEEIMEGK